MHRAIALMAFGVLPAIASPTMDGSSPQACCVALTMALGSDKVFYPSDDSYRRSVSSYFTDQTRVSPTCLLLPRSSGDVAKAVKTLTRTGPCRFAIRSGGHSPWADAANIQDGVTFDLSLLNQVRLSDDRTVASVGPGARWSEVYDALVPLGAAVVGGRENKVGVGGLTTGGGVSYLTARYGFACDNVKNFEIVLGSGEIVNANADERPDLFQALKGGSNNFGIVTRFDLFAFDQGDLWGGFVVYPSEALPRLLPLFARFTDSLAQDPYASLILFHTYTGSINATTVAHAYHYTKPMQDTPAPFRELLNVKPELMRFGLDGPVNLSAATTPPATDPPVRGYQGTLTYANRPDVIARSIEISETMLQPVKGRAGLIWNTVLQPIPRLYSDRSVERGGNIMGLDRREGNYVLFLITVSWNDTADDKDISDAATAALKEVERYTQEVGAANDWIYLNYAGRTQDVIKSYGPQNVAKLRAASKKYDPEQVFQKLVPGGYKIPPEEEQEQEEEEEGGYTDESGYDY